MVKKKEFNSWTLLHLSKKEMTIGILIFAISGIFFRFLGKLIWRKRVDDIGIRAAVIRPKINELTIQELETDMKELNDVMDNLNNDFLSHNKGLMQNTKRFREINKEYLELRLRLNHIMHELEKKKDKEKYDMAKVKAFDENLNKMKNGLDLLSEELERETNEAQSYTLSMLTLIETIFLPLGVLTGYFGMNFSSMGGHVGKGHEPAPGVLGVKYGQGFVWLIMLFCIGVIMYSFDWSKMEHFDSMKHVSDRFQLIMKKRRDYENEDLNNNACRTDGKMRPYNVNVQDFRKIQEKQVDYLWAETMETVDNRKKEREAPRISGKNFLENGSKIVMRTMPQIGKHSLLDLPYDRINFYKPTMV